MNELTEHHAPESAGEAGHATGPKSRPVYDKSVSEATRELRDTSRRRRDAEEKLQQHLNQAKDHVPHHYDRDADEGGPVAHEGDHAAQGKELKEEDPEGAAR